MKCIFKPGEITEIRTELSVSSPFYFGYDIHKDFVDKLKNYDSDNKVFFFTEECLFNELAKPLFNKINKNFKCEVKFLPVGEKSKNFAILEKIGEYLLNKGASKKSILIAFGGGAVGNLVGMIAGLLYRGIRYIEIPTSMTAQTDSTLSNKQAINSSIGKNHFGIYHAPIFVWADTGYLKTEPVSSRRSGIIEGVKNGFISDKDFLLSLESRLKPTVDFTDEELHFLAFDIILSKLKILVQDPSEKNYSIILEYGHTFGHAIEWLGQGKILHGEAVSHGMKIAAEVSRTLGLLTQTDVDYHYHLIEDKLGFNNPVPEFVTVENLFSAMVYDNKKTGDQLRFILLDRIGQCHNPEGDFLVTVENSLLREVITKCCKDK